MLCLISKLRPNLSACFCKQGMYCGLSLFRPASKSIGQWSSAVDFLFPNINFWRREISGRRFGDFYKRPVVDLIKRQAIAKALTGTISITAIKTAKL